MKIINENVFKVCELRDYGNDPILARFYNEDEAYRFAKTVGGYGGKVYAESIQYKIYDSFDEYMSNKTPELKKSALSKLTKEEKIALGL